MGARKRQRVRGTLRKEVERWTPQIPRHWWHPLLVDLGGKRDTQLSFKSVKWPQLTVSSCHGYWPHSAVIVRLSPSSRGVSSLCESVWRRTIPYTVGSNDGNASSLPPSSHASSCLAFVSFYSIFPHLLTQRELEEANEHGGVCVSTRACVCFLPIWCQISLPFAVIDSCQRWCITGMALNCTGIDYPEGAKAGLFRPALSNPAVA